MANQGSYETFVIWASLSGYLEGSIPQDFLSITEFGIVLIPEGDDATHDVFITVANAGNGENENRYLEGILYEGLILTVNEVYFFDLLTPVNLAQHLRAGDVFGITYASQVGNAIVHLLGVRMKYRPRYAEQGGLAPVLEEFYTCSGSAIPT